ncbi:MAG TPA: MarR family transcriptional regulator [Rhizobiaceae bacterium]|nr:MarR family transcriptional regulator [Rhizobiaceae bacterium]
MQKQPPVSPIEAHLGYWLRFVSNQVSHAFSLKLMARDVTVAEWVVLRELYEKEEAVPSLLADRLGMTRGAISKLVDRLAAKSLVARRSNEEDRRYQALALTGEGRTLVPQLSSLADRNDEEFFGHLKPAERVMVESMLKDIVRRHGMRSVPVD